MRPQCLQTAKRILHSPTRFVSIGAYPTPVEPIQSLSHANCSLWVKREDLSSPVYGGNKVRKLEYLLEDAHARGAKRILTIGALGSHHVLATGIFGKRAGFEVDAIFVPQPTTDHVLETLKASLASGVNATFCPSYAHVPFEVLRRIRSKVQPWSETYFIPVGASNVLGTMGYCDAALELMSQVREGALPEPDLHVVALGSGGTAAGIAAGLAIAKSKGRVLGVSTSPPASLLGWGARVLGFQASKAYHSDVSFLQIARKIAIEKRFLGKGYGHPTRDGDYATHVASEVGLTLDPTYTAKAFAACLSVVDSGRAKTVLYWHTLSSASLDWLSEKLLE